MRVLLATTIGAGALAAGGALAATADMGVGYALGGGGSTLSIIGDLTNPVASRTVALNNGGVPTTLDAITYRPNTNGFFGYQDATNTVFSVNVLTGDVMPVVSGGASATDPSVTVGTTTPVVGFDFNNALDAARIVSTNEENLVFFPTPTRDPAELIRATDLFYVAGDVNEGANPNIFANAYTNAVPQAQVDADTQVQYVLDSELDILATLGNNAGTLSTVGQFFVDGAADALDFGDIGGFDILSPSSNDNLGIALLTVGGMSNLYSFAFSGQPGDVQATFLGSLGTGYSSFAVAPSDIAPVPLPASALLLLAGLGGFGLMRRR